jgi:hypothetical protein
MALYKWLYHKIYTSFLYETRSINHINISKLGDHDTCIKNGNSFSPNKKNAKIYFISVATLETPAVPYELATPMHLGRIFLYILTNIFHTVYLPANTFRRSIWHSRLNSYIGQKIAGSISAHSNMYMNMYVFIDMYIRCLVHTLSSRNLPMLKGA